VETRPSDLRLVLRLRLVQDALRTRGDNTAFRLSCRQLSEIFRTTNQSTAPRTSSHLAFLPSRDRTLEEMDAARSMQLPQAVTWDATQIKEEDDHEGGRYETDKPGASQSSSATAADRHTALLRTASMNSNSNDNNRRRKIKRLAASCEPCQRKKSRLVVNCLTTSGPRVGYAFRAVRVSCS
jgi:hypothetical protein